MVKNRPSVLFIDAYDSFTNNIISLLSTTLNCSVRVIHIDSPGFETEESLRSELQHYDAVVCGPGPGDPSKEEDVGIMNQIWILGKDNLLPVLGICLGFQSLCLAFGGHMAMLNEGLHGRVRRIDHIGEFSERDRGDRQKDLFDGVGTLRATLYHSLKVVTNQITMSDAEWQEKKWKATDSPGNLLPLAWAGHETRDKLKWKDDRVLMAVRHRTKPFWGLQYHPESICTNKEGKTVIENWFELAQQWNLKHGRIVRRDGYGVRGRLPRLPSLLSQVERHHLGRILAGRSQKPWSGQNEAFEAIGLDYRFVTRSIDLISHVSVHEIVERLQDMGRDHIILESTNAHLEGVGMAEVRGRYSIIGMDVNNALRIEYHAKDTWARAYKMPSEGHSDVMDIQISLIPYGGIWPLLAGYLDRRRLLVGNANSPFWGGFMGYTTYELGLEGINVNTISDRGHNRPDLCFAWITRSLVVDHLEKKIYVQHLVENESYTWIDETIASLQSLLQPSNITSRMRNSKSQIDFLGPTITKPSITLPNNGIYESKVRACQEQIRKGESYELCLTDQTQVALPRQQTFHKFRSQARNAGISVINKTQATALSETRAWLLYKSLRLRNPAPFASFIRLGTATFVSGSPERFLKWDASGKCELRPMKGTVKKTATVSTLAQAEALLQVPKEQAENLMIVDLVRHDLHGVCGSGNVKVPRLMVVEEYATVFQMISVVEGQIPQPYQGHCDSVSYSTLEQKNKKMRYTGIDVLAASLPPGSMTGAPKKRSCEILQDVEGHRDRSLYSGVVGYMDVGQRGDFSVNIRCMFRWDDEGVRLGEGDTKDRLYQSTERNDADRQDIEVWHIGAGGAITALSSPVAEREEMQAKLNGTLGVFGKTFGTS